MASWTTHLDIPILFFWEMGSIGSTFVKQQMCTSFTEGFFLAIPKLENGRGWIGKVMIWSYIYIYIY
jgi:hypothetical protein